jgi:hypothetical protein
LVLAANGVHATEMTLNATTDIRGEGTMPSQSLALGTLLLPFLPDGCQRVVIRLTEGGIERVVSIPVRAARLWTEAHEGLDKESAFVQAARLTTVDGVPLLSPAQSRGWIAAMARDAQQLLPREAINQLRALRALAESIDEPEGVSPITEHIKAVRMVLVQNAPDDASHETLQRVMDWSRRG